jgi:hypothetical protein
MDPRRPPWHVEREGLPEFAFFISHVAEDSDAVVELKSQVVAISGRGGRPPLACFLDVQAWPVATNISEVIKEFLINCEYMIVWVTPAYLDGGARGWVWVELAYAELLEISLNYPSPPGRFPYIVPVFRGVRIGRVARTPLLPYWQRPLMTPQGRRYPIVEIARTLVAFYDQQERKRRSSNLPGPGR